MSTISVESAVIEDLKSVQMRKSQFKDIVASEISRDGINDLMQYIESRDFFIAPASTRFHNAFDGGLVDHSINVYDALMRIDNAFQLHLKSESMAICGLFHDLCKMDFYTKTRRMGHDKWGNRIAQDVYEINELMPLGHGEKSVILLERFMQLTPSEMYAIRWHMGAFDNAVKGGERSINNAFDKCPLAVALHMADMAATYLMESKAS